ncbi:DoxX family protein [Lutimonas sp.]|uniref:DoxX family protein n=1 Tax=Lutimonas sp. TaxID=1872403 RepID=UPI003D9B366C
MKNFQQNTGLLILRLSIGGLMLFHGIHKLINGVDGLVGMFSNMGLPGFVAYGAYLGEFLAPIFIIIGYRTKIASLFVAATMLVAAMTAHADEILKIGDHGEWALELIGLYLFGAFSIFFLGAGKFAVSSSNKWD